MAALSRATLIHTPRGCKSLSWLLGDLSVLRLESHRHSSPPMTLRHSPQKQNSLAPPLLCSHINTHAHTFPSCLTAPFYLEHIHWIVYLQHPSHLSYLGLVLL